jgi:hypothetical protein
VIYIILNNPAGIQAKLKGWKPRNGSLISILTLAFTPISGAKFTYPVGTENCLPRQKVQGHKDNHRPPSNSDIENEGIYLSSPADINGFVLNCGHIMKCVRAQ